MKKLYFMLAFLLLVCGCEKKNNNLECSINNDVDLYSNSVVIKVNDDSIIIEQSFNVRDEFKELVGDSLFDSVIESYTLFDKDSIKVDSKKSDNGFNVNIKIDKTKMNDDAKNDIISLFNIDTNKNIDEIKKSLETDGYTCK